jgi:acyl carrier protein
MERKEIIGKTRDIIADVLKYAGFEWNNDLTAADIDGWDSLSHMVIITEIEEEFKVKFKLKELNKLDNLNSLIDLIQSKVQ